MREGRLRDGGSGYDIREEGVAGDRNLVGNTFADAFGELCSQVESRVGYRETFFRVEMTKGHGARRL